MKKFTQGIALVAVTTLFVSAFTTNHWDQHTPAATVDGQVAQVVITGKRMTALEKAQYDVEMLSQKTSPAAAGQSDSYRVAVK